MTDPVRLTIDRLGHAGDGIAPGPVYVPRTLPGEVVEGNIDGTRMETPRIVVPSPDRVSAPCPHYRTCGGCALQHASDAFVAGWKADVVRRALTAQGIEAEVGPVETSPPGARRRATLSGRRTKKGAIVGFHGRASGALTAIPGCLLLAPALMRALPALEALTRLGAARSGEISLAITETQNGVDVAVDGAKPVDAPMMAGLAALADRHGLSRLTWNGEIVATLSPPVQDFGGVEVAPPPGAFLQATEEGRAALSAFAGTATAGAARIADLFAGSGTFSLPLAKGAEVHAVEGEAAALAALETGWRRAAGLKRVTIEVRDLFRRPLLPDELRRFDAAVIDPPRAGAEAQTRELAAAGPPVIAFISCNPATFARDAAILIAAGYAMGPVLVVDQFRWSTHVEVAARFSR